MLFNIAKQRGRITSLSLPAILLLMQPRTPLAFFAARAHCWFMFNVVSTRTPRALFCNVAFQLVGSQPVEETPSFLMLKTLELRN